MTEEHQGQSRRESLLRAAYRRRQERHRALRRGQRDPPACGKRREISLLTSYQQHASGETGRRRRQW